MRGTAETVKAERRVCMVLADTAHHLTSRDLLKVAEIADKVHAVVHIRFGSWQVMLSVPEQEYSKADQALQAVGRAYRVLSGTIYPPATFFLNVR